MLIREHHQLLLRYPPRSGLIPRQNCLGHFDVCLRGVLHIDIQVTSQIPNK